MSTRIPRSLVVLALLAQGLTAQERMVPSPAPQPMPIPIGGALGGHPFRVPIHTLQADERFGEYGRWASGDDYKVSFHDGFVFHPILGMAYPENLPWRWTTRSITVGGKPVVDLSSPEHEHTDWRYEYRFRGVTEAYDLRPDGVEQTFVIAERPWQAGDLVVEGRIDTALVARPTQAAHQEIVFADAAGKPLVRYGKAFAFDAQGVTVAITTEFDGDSIRLVVPGDWLAAARFPVTVDPLTSIVEIAFSSGNAAPERAAIHREDESSVLGTMVVYTRAASASDSDVFAKLCSADFQQAHLAFVDVGSGWSDLFPDVAFVGGADRWAIGWWRHTGAEDRVRAYFHDRENTVPNSGVLASNHNPGTEHASFPTVGGRSHPTLGTDGVMVYRMDPFFGNSSTSELRLVQLDAVNRTFGGSSLVAAAPLDAEAPDVNCQIGWGDDGWIVTYQARTSAIDDYDIYIDRISANGFGLAGATWIGPNDLGDKVRPVVQGWDGRYLVAMLSDVTPEIHGNHFARAVIAARLDWHDNRSQPRQYLHRTVATSPNQDLTRLNLGFDGVSTSHWCLVFDSNVFTWATAQVRRLGFSGAVTESADLGAPTYHAAVTWNGPAREFLIVNCNNTLGAPVQARRFQYSNASWNLVYGTGCGPGTITSDTMPFPGTQFYRVRLENAPPGQLGMLGFAFTAGSTALDPIGAPNCTDNRGAGAAYLPASTDPIGAATFTVALPDSPLFLGDVYWQFVYMWPSAPTPLPIGVTRGMRSSVR